MINCIITQGVVVPGITGVTVTSITKTDFLRDLLFTREYNFLPGRE